MMRREMRVLDLIPMPELFVVLVVAVTVYGLRAVWALLRSPVASSMSQVSLAREERIETERKRAQLMASCLLLIAISVPLILRAVPPNGLYGFRTAATQSSSTIWYPANAFLGWALSISSTISIVGLVLLPSRVKRWMLWVTFLVPMLAAVVASFLYLSQLS